MPTILFVDDEPSILNAMRRSLRGEAYEVETAATGRDALEIVRTRPVDVLVSDARMAGMNGFQLIEQVRIECPGIVCIMLTGEADLAATTALIQSGALYRFLCKPLSPAALRGVLHGALQMRKWAAEAESRSTRRVSAF